MLYAAWELDREAGASAGTSGQASGEVTFGGQGVTISLWIERALHRWYFWIVAKPWERTLCITFTKRRYLCTLRQTVCYELTRHFI